MKKVFILISLSVLAFLISSFVRVKKSNTAFFTKDVVGNINYVPNEKEINEYHVQIPFIGNKFIGFREAVAFKESQGDYQTINSLGYLGKYQFGKSTLERFKIYDTELFLQTPQLQERAFVALCSLNKWILIRDIKRSVGKNINGVKITESGILAAAHLAGAGNVKTYLRSNGEVQFNDAFGSSIQHYLKEFSGYDTSSIEPVKNPKVHI